MLRRIFGPKRNDAAKVGWSRTIRCLMMERNADTLLVGKPHRMRPLWTRDAGGCIILEWFVEKEEMGWFGLD
jgi:hypothetical protein